MIRIGIDCRLSGIENAGIGRYIENLVNNLVLNGSIHWVLFIKSSTQLSHIQESQTVTKVIADIPHYSVAEQLALPVIFAKADLNLLHVPHFNIPFFYTGDMVVTIHDLLWHEQKGKAMTTLGPLEYDMKYFFYRRIVAASVARSKRIFVPANTVKQKVLELYPDLDSSKIIVTYEGVEKQWFEKSTTSKHPQKILFYTGSLYPHKNVMLIVKALEMLPEYQLHISASRTVFVDSFLKQVKDLGMESRVKYLGFLTDSQLKEEYGSATALIQPSFSEGFGLTGVEAMAAGIPVIASDIPIFREIYNEAALFFDPFSVEQFVHTVENLTPRKRSQLTLAGTQCAKRFSWQRMAEQTLEEYQRVLGVQ